MECSLWTRVFPEQFSGSLKSLLTYSPPAKDPWYNRENHFEPRGMVFRSTAPASVMKSHRLPVIHSHTHYLIHTRCPVDPPSRP